MEEGGVWNSGMMWRNDGKMDGWHYANSPVDCKIAPVARPARFSEWMPCTHYRPEFHHADTPTHNQVCWYADGVFRDPSLPCSILSGGRPIARWWALPSAAG